MRSMRETLLLCWIGVVAAVVHSTTSSLSVAQVNALLSLYNSTQGPHWYIKWPVTDTSNACGWHGVTCSSGNDDVIQLKLAANNLVGILIGSIKNLKHLSILDLSYNHLSGPIPSSLGNLTNLQSVDLSSNKLSGPIPSTLGNLTNLQVLGLNLNRLSSSLPSSLENLTNLQDLALYSNQLSGSIPSSLGNLINLQYLQLHSNQLTGTIPSSLGNLTNLQELSLDTNQVSGSIPSSLGNLTNLNELYLSSNTLSGSIPSSLGDLTNLPYLYLDTNQLTGTIPSSLGNLTNLQYLDLSSNTLSGSIPSSLENLTNLQYLVLGLNQLSGSIPSSLGNLINIWNLDLSLNQLSGSIPSSLGNLTNLQSVYLYSNQVSGSIPSSLGNLINLQNLYLYSNQLSGTIPSLFDVLCKIEQLLLSSNQLSGTIPSSLGNLTNLQYLDLSSNQLTGTIPSSLGNLTNLQDLALYSNQLSGSIPPSFGNLTNIRNLYLYSNQLSGSIPDLSAIANLLFFNAYDNRLSGPLPISMLQNGHLQELILSANCFSGMIPSEICMNVNMTELVMGGLHAAQSCTQREVQGATSFGLHSSHVQSTAIHGFIPSCIFNMPTLTYLSLSGNNLVGSLSRDLAVVPTLQKLDLSHNRLTGSIPNTLFNHGFSSLDLSFNRFTGTISENASGMYSFNLNTSLSLQVNLLSGTLPVAWTEAASINVLEGNMFACKDGMGPTINLPVHDPSADSYQCGSQYTNISLLICLFLFVVYSFVLSIISRLRHNWLNGEFVQEGWRLIMVWVRSGRASWWLWWMLVIFCCSMSLYGGLTVYDRTYSEQYVWTVALSGQKGVLSAVLLLLWLLFVLGRVLGLDRQMLTSRRDAVCISDKDKGCFGILYFYKVLCDCVWTRLWNWRYVCILMLTAANIVVVLAFNGLFVLSTTQQLSKSLSICSVLMITLFKLVWNSVLHHVGINVIFNHRVEGEAGILVVQLDSVLTVLSVFNNILAPLVTEIFVNPNCLKYIFFPMTTVLFPAPPICTPESLIEIVIDDDRLYPIPQSINICSSQPLISYTPGFTYNFECSSSMLHDFTFAFIFRCMLNLFLVPMVWILLKRWQQQSFVRSGTSSWLFRLLTACLPPLLRPLSRPSDYFTKEINSENTMGQIMKEWKYFNASTFQYIGKSGANRCISQLRIRLLADVSILLSFGILFPPLGLLVALVMGLDVLGTMLIIRRLRHLGRVEKKESGISSINADNTESLEAYYPLWQEIMFALDAGFAEVQWKFAENMRFVLHTVVLLWGFALFDVLGREVGVIAAIWVLIVTVTSPVWLHWIVSLLMSRLNSLWSSMKKEDTTSDIEAKGSEMIIQNPIIDNESTARIESQDTIS